MSHKIADKEKVEGRQAGHFESVQDVLEIEVIDLIDDSQNSLENIVFTRSTSTTCSTS